MSLRVSVEVERGISRGWNLNSLPASPTDSVTLDHVNTATRGRARAARCREPYSKMSRFTATRNCLKGSLGIGWKCPQKMQAFEIRALKEASLGSTDSHEVGCHTDGRFHWLSIRAAAWSLA
jgi:hypothetical protein